MAEAKKYFWLKIKPNFFDDPIIRIIEHGSKGDMVLVCYIRMLLDSIPKGVVYIADRNRIAHRYSVSVKDFEYAIYQLSLYQLIFVENDIVSLPYITKNTIYASKEITGRDRNTSEYQQWRKAVFIRDKFTCQKCGVRGCKLNAHHIKLWCSYPDERFEVNNGITLCEECHKKEHRRRK